MTRQEDIEEKDLINQQRGRAQAQTADRGDEVTCR
jgi:hypothetical protein